LAFLSSVISFTTLFTVVLSTNITGAAPEPIDSTGAPNSSVDSSSDRRSASGGRIWLRLLFQDWTESGRVRLPSDWAESVKLGMSAVWRDSGRLELEPSMRLLQDFSVSIEAILCSHKNTNLYDMSTMNLLLEDYSHERQRLICL
jgi:hypothetical protein